MVLENIKYLGMPLKTRELEEYIVKKLSKLNIEVVDARAYSDNISFVSNSENKKFKSTVVNKIIMSPNDPRIAKLGRDYLESTRLTKKQSDALIKLFFEDLVKVGITFDMEDNGTVYVANGLVRKMWPEPKNYPIE